MMNKSVDERGGESAVVDHRVPLFELKVRGGGHAPAGPGGVPPGSPLLEVALDCKEAVAGFQPLSCG